MWFRQIAQLSTTMSSITETKSNQLDEKSDGENLGIRVRKETGKKSLPQAQRDTAFHFLISNRFGFLEEGPAALLEASPAGTIVTSESSVAIVFFLVSRCEISCVVLRKISIRQCGKIK